MLTCAFGKPARASGLSARILFSFAVSFGVSTNSEQRIPVKRIIIRIDEIHFVFVLIIPFFYVVAPEDVRPRPVRHNPKAMDRPIHKCISFLIRQNPRVLESFCGTILYSQKQRYSVVESPSINSILRFGQALLLQVKKRN